MANNLIATYRSIPKELFRVNRGPLVQLRLSNSRHAAYDIVLHDGLAQPRALNRLTYKAPNGATLRPNSQFQQMVVAQLFHGPDTVVYAVPKGTRLPEELILVHEKEGHYSLEPARKMPVEELNEKITDFLQANGKKYTREDWLKTYREATDAEGRAPVMDAA